MPLQVAMLEAKLKQLRQQVLVLGERHHAVPDVSRRQHLEVFSKSPGRAAVIRYRDNRRKFPHGAP
jgi:hypothetical protein